MRSTSWEKPGAGSRDKVKHMERNDQLYTRNEDDIQNVYQTRELDFLTWDVKPYSLTHSLTNQINTEN